MQTAAVNNTQDNSVTSDLIFLVLPGIGEARDDSRHTNRRRYLTRIDHDEELHQVIVDLAGSTLDDVDIFTAHRLSNLHTTSAGEGKWNCESENISV